MRSEVRSRRPPFSDFLPLTSDILPLIFDFRASISDLLQQKNPPSFEDGQAMVLRSDKLY
jgi:hypothetical protein